MKIIPLVTGIEVFVDDDDYENLINFRWRVTRERYAISQINGKEVLMHRLILKTPKGFGRDHKNGNGFDNRKENLRICTRSENQKNKKSSGKSKYIGVSWNKWHNKWTAQININGKVKWLGYFQDELSAARKYLPAVFDIN